jgi:proprotein convertase subtilisin/kexin type 5
MAAECPLGCESCSSLTSCSACKTNFFMRGDRLCYSSCPDRYSPDQNTKICKICPFDCLTCSLQGTCLSCSYTSDHRTLDNTTGRCMPAAGYLDIGTTVCVQCPNGCQSCFSLKVCSACHSGYFMRADNLCYDNCLDRYYQDSQNNTCKACPYDCLRCLSNGSCLACDDPVDHRVLDNSTLRCVPFNGFF